MFKIEWDNKCLSVEIYIRMLSVLNILTIAHVLFQVSNMLQVLQTHTHNMVVQTSML